MKLIVNMPVYNEEAKVGETIARIRKNFSSDFYTQGEGAKISQKLIQVVDDGSTDNTVEIAKKAGVDLIVSYKPNRRLAYAFKRSVENALENGADIMVNIDADGQFDPNDIPKLLLPILVGQADMVIANRFGKHEAKNMPKIKYYLNRLAAKIVGFFLAYPIDDLTCGFRAHNRETLLRLNITNVSFTYTQETIIDAIGKNLKLKWVSVEIKYFADRKSRVVKSVWNFVSNSAKIILKAVRDVRPMKFFGVPGLIVVIASLLVFILFLYHYFQTFEITTYRNYLFLSVILMFVGSQLLIFALIADMIKTNRNLTEEQMYLLKKDRLKK
jgi:glycosyltransferase involved in cell wall biosynthesis